MFSIQFYIFERIFWIFFEEFWPPPQLLLFQMLYMISIGP